MSLRARFASIQSQGVQHELLKDLGLSVGARLTLLEFLADEDNEDSDSVTDEVGIWKYPVLNLIHDFVYKVR